MSEDQSRKEFYLVAYSPNLVHHVHECSYWRDVVQSGGVATW